MNWNALLKQESSAIVKIVVGSILYALSVVLFIDPVSVIPGSVTGIAVVVKAVTGFPIGVFSILVNVPLIIFGTIKLGKRLLIYTGLTIFLTSVLTDAFAFLPAFSQDILLDSIFGGIVMGIGLGLIMDGGGTTGGTTLVGRLVSQKRPHIPMGNILLVGDFIIITVGSLVLQNWDLLLYSLIDLYVCVVALNYTMYGFKTRALSIITTEKQTEVADHICGNPSWKILSSGVGTLTVVSKKSDVSKIQREIKGIDIQASCESMDVDYSF